MQHLPLDVQLIITQFSNELRGIAPDFVSGLYITGSVVLDDFHSDKSDIDFVVVCHNLDLPKLQSMLARIHKKMEANPKAAALNGVYLIPDHLDVNKSHHRKILRYQKGRVEEVSFDMAPILLYELKTTGMTVRGIGIEELKIRIDFDNVKEFMFKNINSYWKKWVDDHSSILKKKILLILFPRLTEWGVLGVARQYCTLMTGRIASKTAAGHFVLDHVSAEQQKIVREAIQIRSNQNNILAIRKSYSINPSIERTHATLACMHEIIALFDRECDVSRLPK